MAVKRGGRRKKENEFYEEKEPRGMVEKGKKSSLVLVGQGSRKGEFVICWKQRSGQSGECL